MGEERLSRVSDLVSSFLYTSAQHTHLQYAEVGGGVIKVGGGPSR